MREIKFRAWDRQNGYWIDETDFFIDPDGEVEVFDAPTDSWRIGGPITLCQYTGLKDKNGKEIYEGDVVKWLYYKQSRAGKIVWEKCGFWIEGFLDVLDMRTNELEVIGNIYEGQR